MEMSRWYDYAECGEKCDIPTPEVCPQCGAKYRGGATRPGSPMKKMLPVYFDCGSSIRVKGEFENGRYVKFFRDGPECEG